jgi:pyrroloquinoline quinone (PQQ) biosynthesis protein C
MQSACQRCNQLQKDDLLSTGLIRYFGRHIQEETGHDEWLLNDLETIGVSRQEALSRKPLQAVAELVGSQYYWIYHWHPVTLLGYIAYLEGDPPTKELIRNLERISGYPYTAFRTFIKHSELDPHHREELNQALDTLNLTTQYQRWITSNALYSADKFHELRNYSSNASRAST